MTSLTQKERINLRIHPRVFAALGADLVTSDLVAILELVKNCYDANARNAWIRFRHDAHGRLYIEIEDDGIGMTRQTIGDAWCMIATPYKTKHTHIGKGKRQRRVSGEKGLGRLSAARLGSILTLLTRAQGQPCYKISVDWDDLSQQTDLSSCTIELEQVDQSPFKRSGTILRIEKLSSAWNEDTFIELEENLARLLSPFFAEDDFSIMFHVEQSSKGHELKIEPPAFLSQPKYKISGNVDEEGSIRCEYVYSFDEEPRKSTIDLYWEQVLEALERRVRGRRGFGKAACGPFSFEIRAWDIGVEDIRDIESRFDYKGNVRKAIAAHKGLSVYRDYVLVLPKSEGAKDWLGLDLRRVSKLTRLSTSQVVGYVSISADTNPALVDTSDRERLVDNDAARDFRYLLVSIVSLLEAQRLIDRKSPDTSRKSNSLFDSLSAEGLIDEISERADEGATASDVLPVLQDFNKTQEKAIKELEERFVYYSRLATIGTIASMIVHEIRNRTMAIGPFLEEAYSRFGPFKDKLLATAYGSASSSVDTLERLADTFLPLASRSHRRRLRQTILEERILECCSILHGELERKKIVVKRPSSTTKIAVDPGELDAIIINLMNNAIYWLSQTDVSSRKIEFQIVRTKHPGRIEVQIHDSGPGIDEEDAERVFWPGVTKKPGGIGMGLTVAAELVSDYSGKLGLRQPGKLGGATFIFDVPLRK